MIIRRNKDSFIAVHVIIKEMRRKIYGTVLLFFVLMGVTGLLTRSRFVISSCGDSGWSREMAMERRNLSATNRNSFYCLLSVI